MTRGRASALAFCGVLAASSLATGTAVEAAETTYRVDRTVGTGKITGTIVTNGTLGPLRTTDILDWNLTVDGDGTPATTGKLLGPRSGANSSLTSFPLAALTATATGLFFDFSLTGPPPGPPLPPPAPPGPPAIVQFAMPTYDVVWQLQGGFFSDELIRESSFPLVQAHTVRPPAPDQIAAAGPPPPMIITTDTTLTADWPSSIVVDADEVTLDCAGHAVKGEGSGIGIHLAGRRGVAVTGCVVSGFAEGIVLSASSQNRVEFNTVIGTDASGIVVTDGSGSNEFTGNVSSHNGKRGFDVVGASFNTFLRNVAVGNDHGGFVVSAGARKNTLRENTACLNDPVDATEERQGPSSNANHWIQNLFCAPSF